MLLRNSLTLFASLSCFVMLSQAGPGLISGSDHWIAGDDSSTVIANKYVIDLLDPNSPIKSPLSTINSDFTIFIVAHPDSLGTDPALFAKIGTFYLGNDGVYLNGNHRPVSFEDGLSKVIAVSAPHRESQFLPPFRGEFDLINENLFDLAELVIYDELLDSNEIRLVTSYLSIKHSVPLARNNQKFTHFKRGIGGKYWNEKISKIYNHDITGLGLSKNESLYQTQSSTQNDSLIIGLDTIIAPGKQPSIQVSDKSFVIFSQARKDFRKYLTCNYQNFNPNPINTWKFELQNWYSAAKSLKVKVRGPFLQADTVRLLSKGFYLDLPSQISADSARVYTIPISELPNNQHYFFRSSFQNDSCPDLVDIALLDSMGTVELSSLNDSIESFELINMSTGATLQFDASLPGQATLMDDEYLLVAKKDGKVIYAEPVSFGSMIGEYSQSKGTIPNVDLFPIPGKVSSVVQVTGGNLENGVCQIIATDMAGKLIYKKDQLIEDNSLNTEIPTPLTPGVLKITLLQNDRNYSFLVPIIN